jgi:hypothetical protein
MLCAIYCGNGGDVQRSLRHRRRRPILGGVSAQEGWRTGAGAVLSPQPCVLKGVVLALLAPSICGASGFRQLLFSQPWSECDNAI